MKYNSTKGRTDFQVFVIKKSLGYAIPYKPNILSKTPLKNVLKDWMRHWKSMKSWCGEWNAESHKRGAVGQQGSLDSEGHVQTIRTRNCPRVNVFKQSLLASFPWWKQMNKKHQGLPTCDGLKLFAFTVKSLLYHFLWDFSLLLFPQSLSALNTLLHVLGHSLHFPASLLFLPL